MDSMLQGLTTIIPVSDDDGSLLCSPWHSLYCIGLYVVHGVHHNVRRFCFLSQDSVLDRLGPKALHKTSYFGWR